MATKIDTTKGMTAKEYLKLHLEQYVMVTREFGEPIYIAPLKNMCISVTLDRSEAEKWSALDNGNTKLSYHKSATGYKGLKFEQL